MTKSRPESGNFCMKDAGKGLVKVLFENGDILHPDRVKLSPKYSLLMKSRRVKCKASASQCRDLQEGFANLDRKVKKRKRILHS